MMFLLLAGAKNSTWAATVTYHILTLPIDNDIYHMKTEVNGWRLEAVKVVVDNADQVRLPSQYKSPLVSEFKYYKASDITNAGKAATLYDNASIKGIRYKVKGIDTEGSSTPVAEGSDIDATEYYVIYTYNVDNNIVKLDGSVRYNIKIKNKGFLAYNRGRNNRPAVVPDNVAPEMLSSEDFVKIDNPGGGITTYWDGGTNNKNSRDSTESKFFFGFKFEGNDPYHIIVRTSYVRNYTFIEKNEDGDKAFVYKWYKGATLMANGTGNAYLASDDHKRYSTTFVSGKPNPTDPGSVLKNGYFHGNTCTWGTLALLNNNNSSGYVFMGSRTVDGNGNPYTTQYYLKFDNNNLNFDNTKTLDEISANYSTEGFYPIKKVTFKVPTPFYKIEPTADHIISVESWVSQYAVDNSSLDTKYIPAALKRKYCNFNGDFYKDAARTQKITKFTDANYDPTEGYQVYLGYAVEGSPFKAITPLSSYSDDTWKAATWYELTDKDETENKKIKWNGTPTNNFQNNGVSTTYDKESEYAFIGDPYELQVIHRSQTSGSIPYYLGSKMGVSRTANILYGTNYEYYEPAGAQTMTFHVSGFAFDSGNKYNVTIGGTDAGQVTAVTPASVTDLSSTSADVIVTVNASGGIARTFTVTITETESDGTTTVGTPTVITVHQSKAGYSWDIPDDDTDGSFLLRKLKDTGHWYWNVEGTDQNVTYSTASSTRVKVKELPKYTYIYHIVDKSGRIAVKASIEQPIFLPLSETVSSTLESTLPPIIVSPYLVGETLKYYDDAYVDGTGRGNLSSEITETPIVNNQDIYVTYTTTRLNDKPINLSEDQEFNVRLNGEFLWYDATDNSIKTNPSPSNDNLESKVYRWKLRNRDPYNMLIDNVGAREDPDFNVANQTEPVIIYNDNGVSVDDEGRESSNPSYVQPTRQIGAWVKLAADLGNNVALMFTTTRTGVGGAQPFIPKSALQRGIYEVMVAAGDGINATSETYYHIGRTAHNVVKIYDKAHYEHGNDVLRFKLEQSVGYIYHLIDKSNHELLEQTNQSPELNLPEEYQSPLVDTYHYYDQDNISEEDGVWTLKPGATELADISDLDATFTSDKGAYSEQWTAADAAHQLTAANEEDMAEQAKKLTDKVNPYYFNVGADYYQVTVTKPFYTHVYVTYDKNNLVTFNDDGKPYLLKFLKPFDAGYYLEDGNDKLTANRIQAVYPYTNGDGSLNIYGQAMNEEQMGGGANTRPRWVWFFDSDNNDPYHVKIHSKSTISYNSVSHPTYLQTYAVHFKQDANEKQQRIVTGGILPGIASVTPTEYMILGVAGNYKLLTTNAVEADLNGDGNTTGAGENDRQYVTSLEQYWKTYNMIKLHLLEIPKSEDEFSNDESTWVVPDGKRTQLKTKLEAKQNTATDDGSDLTAKINALTSTGVYYFRIGTSAPYTYKKVTVINIPASTLDTDYTIEECSETDWQGLNYVNGWFWHSYDVIANATRWNGYNDKSDGHEKKCVEKREHWFQTFDMGDGAFDIEDANIPPVLILLDRHGWEIMRRPLPTTAYPEGNELKDLMVFDSPMVEKYHFYSNATKATGCHKYTLRTNDSGYRDEIKDNGVAYTSKSLGKLPPITATGVVSGGAIQDFYVTYTVKEEYEKSYKYELNYTEVKDGDGKVTGYTITSETGTPSKFVIVQNGRYARIEIPKATTNKSYLSKPVPQATSPTGGNVYDMILNPSNVEIKDVTVDADGDGKIDNDNLWYVQPNLDIDNEMGIVWGTAISGNEPLSAVATKVAYKDKTGFDPYNLQLRNAKDNRFYTSAISSTRLHNGIWEGTLSSNGIELKAATTSGYVTPEGYDHTILQITNQTFMAVSDANGNMQLMPRFDHTKRINVSKGGVSTAGITTLEDPEDHDLAVATDNASMGPQTVFMVRPLKFEYHIIDHDGNEALRYKTAGEYSPSIPDRFRSPLATDFKYYYGTTVYDTPESGAYATQWEKAEATYKRTALTDALVTSQANYLPEIGDYYFRIGTNPASYTYKKVTVTKVKEIDKLFADAGLDADVNQVYVRYRYWKEADVDKNKVLQGKWFTINLANKDLQSTETQINETGDNVFLYADDVETPTKVAPIDGSDGKRKWQWKFLSAPTEISSPYYREIDPYAVQLFNRKANYEADVSRDPNPMSIGIKVGGHDRFVLLSHPNEGYALAVAGLESYSYSYINGDKMATPSTTAASIVEECYQKSINAADYDALKTVLAEGPDAVYYVKLNGTEVTDVPTYKKVTVTSHEAAEGTCTPEEWEKSYISIGAQLLLNDDVTHTFTYNVITNGNKLAVSATQSNDEASGAQYVPILPNSIQSPLLNMEDYKYYGSASVSSSTYTVVDATKLFTLLGLYDDVVYVRYNPYDIDKTKFKVPNKRNATSTGTISVAADSKKASLNISGGLPYNIIWEDDKMMTSTDGSAISNGGSQNLDGSAEYVWRLYGDDPYAIQIRRGSDGLYVNGTGTLNATPKDFMLLRNDDYEYGVLQVTGTTGDDAGKKLTGYGGELTADASTAPKYFIIFGLSVHDLIYHLVIARTCTDEEKSSAVEGDQKVTIPVRTTVSGDLNNVPIWGTSQRDLKTTNTEGGVPGEKYQLGETITWGGSPHTYSIHVGQVSIGGDLNIPIEFYRPNCTFEYYVEGIYDTSSGTELLADTYKGLKLTNEKLMSDADLINQTVVINIVYSFDKTLKTNSGLDFVRSTADNFWYTFETYDGATPYLAHYTNAWGLQSMEGRETRYTNDYLWTPLGDPYGFRMYNRYMIKNSGADDKVMTTDNASFTSVVEGTKLKMAVPGEDDVPKGNEVYELLKGDADGYFRIHPVINTKEQTQYYVRRYNNKSVPDYDGGGSDLDYTILSTEPCDWRFGLDMTLLEPYYIQAGYIGGLTTTAKDPSKEPKSGKQLYEDALKENIMKVQKVVYDDDNIVDFAPGYYRLHSMPGTPGISTIRYASGYSHKTELTGDGVTDGPIPMHFYSKVGTSTTFGSSGLDKGYTKMKATQGEIPVPATEYDPSTIFYLDGEVDLEDEDDNVNPRVTMSTQGLYVKGIVPKIIVDAKEVDDPDHGDAVMTATEGDATKFSLIGIGGAVFLITNELDPATRNYLHYGQDYVVDEDNKIYDLKYYHNSPTNEARWCIAPADSLMVTMNNGGDGYYYSTFCAPYDVLLPDDVVKEEVTTKAYYAYTCDEWDDNNLHPKKVPAVTSPTSYDAGKFVPAGTPVIFRIKDESGSMKLTLPSNAPTEIIDPTSPLKKNIFSGTYLEQLLDVDESHDVYTLGLPFTSDVKKDETPEISGDIDAPVFEKATSGIGFYINATPNKEADPLQSLWRRNNRYVIHNKIYYRAGSSGSSAPQLKGPEFVPVIFDDEEDSEELTPNGTREIVGDGCIYDLMGRKVATREQVEDGSWKQRVATGIYILNGKKFQKK